MIENLKKKIFEEIKDKLAKIEVRFSGEEILKRK